MMSTISATALAVSASSAFTTPDPTAIPPKKSTVLLASPGSFALAKAAWDFAYAAGSTVASVPPNAGRLLRRCDGSHGDPASLKFRGCFAWAMMASAAT